MNIIKIRDSLFSLFTWYQSQRENLIYIFGDRVSFQSLYSPPRTFHRRISSPSPLVTFSASSSPARNLRFRGARGRSTLATPLENNPARTVTRRSSLAACRPRAGACECVDHFPVTRLHIQARPTPSCCSIPPTVHPKPSLSTFLPISAPPHSVSRSSPRFGSPFFISSSTTVISSSTAVIRPLIRALFNPNVIQSPVKWIWQLKILFLHLLTLDLLLSHEKN